MVCQVKLALIIIVAVLPIASFASQDVPTKGEILSTIEHMQRLAKEQQVELDAANLNETNIQTKLTATQGFLGKATSSLIKVQGQIQLLAQHDANETAAKKHILHKYHILKGIACIIAAAVAVFIVMRLTSFIPLEIMPYKIYLYAGAGTMAAEAVAIFL